MAVNLSTADKTISLARTNGAQCLADLPRSGLGNMLLVWARALVFARLNDMPLLVSRWGHFKAGPLLRRERRHRMYFGYFDDRSSIGSLKKLLILKRRHPVFEPEIIKLSDAERFNSSKLYVFRAVPHWSDYFLRIKDYRGEICAALNRMLTAQYQKQLLSIAPPVIGVHVRQGDFRELKPDEDFAKVGHVRTPLSYFKNLINTIRQIHGSSLPVTIFSDGNDNDLAELLEMPDVSRASGNSDIVDLLLLAKAKIIVPSAGSTFGYWSAFLSDAVVLHHPDHTSHALMRPESVNKEHFEGWANVDFESWPEQLMRNIKEIEV